MYHIILVGMIRVIPDNPPCFSLFPPFFEYHSMIDKNWPKMMIYYYDNTLFRRIFGYQ